MYRVPQGVRYSQNFIKDANLVKRLINRSCIFDSEIIIEIGAGKGTITKELLKKFKKVVAIEADIDLYLLLKERLVNYSNLQLINMDITKYHLPTYEYSVFSNIPFNYTSRIIRKLFFSSNPPLKCYLFLQKEAARKFIGEPKETQISLLLKPFFQMQIIYKFNRSGFEPKPRVQSVFVEILKRTDPLVDVNTVEYRDFIVYATTQWKSTLKTSLKKVFTHEQFKRLSTDICFDINAKPLDLSFQQWLTLFYFYAKNVCNGKKELVKGAYFKQQSIQKRLKKMYRIGQ